MESEGRTPRPLRLGASVIRFVAAILALEQDFARPQTDPSANVGVFSTDLPYHIVPRPAPILPASALGRTESRWEGPDPTA